MVKAASLLRESLRDELDRRGELVCPEIKAGRACQYKEDHGRICGHCHKWVWDAGD